MNVIRVQFKPLGKKYFFGVGKYHVKDKTAVIVNTIRGTELGFCVGDVFDLDEKDLTSELKDIVRIASKDDFRQYNHNKSLEPQVLEKTKEFAKKSNLEMKVLECEYTLDCSKLIIYFEAEGRIDFRELVKNLADEYHTRIELRQVGSRDGAKVFGGVGPCGLIVCCQTFITEFENVTVKMAKNQNLSLNPVKISGNCGKLLCCISYENDIYTELRRGAPDVGDIVMTEKGEAKVLSCDILNRNIKVKYLDEEGSFGYLKLDDVTLVRKKISGNQPKKEEIDDACGM